MSTTDLGNFVRHRREELGLTQEQIAAEVGVVPQQISNIERGITVHPTNETLQRLARALHVWPQVIGGLIGMWQDGIEGAGELALPDELTPDAIWAEFMRRFNGDEHAAREALLQALQRSFPR